MSDAATGDLELEPIRKRCDANKIGAWPPPSQEFILAAARSDVPALLDHIVAVEAERDALAAKIAAIEGLYCKWRDMDAEDDEVSIRVFLGYAADELDAALHGKDGAK